MGRFVIAAAGLYLALLIAALADCLGGDDPPRRLSRGLWTAMIICLPIGGAIAWFLAGRPRRDDGPRRRPSPPPTSPDDDPDFLRDLDRQIRDDPDFFRNMERRLRGDNDDS